MLNGAAVMDAALLLIAGNEACPQPQTSEHLAAVEIMRLANIIILQNKVDLVKPADASMQFEQVRFVPAFLPPPSPFSCSCYWCRLRRYFPCFNPTLPLSSPTPSHHPTLLLFTPNTQIRKFVAGTVADSSPIIPISAVKKFNIDVVCEYLVNRIPIPPRDFTSSPRLIVIRSFDVNKPGELVEDLKGGVAGGSILQGVLKLGDQIEVRPGIVTKDAEGNVKCVPIFSQITSLFAEHNELEFAVPGGLIGVGTRIDPTLTRADRLVGQVLGLRGQLPDVFTEVEISYYLLRRLLGVKTQDGGKQAKVQKLAAKEILMVNIGSTATGGKVLGLREDVGKREDYAKILLTQPVCTQEGEKIALSRRVDKHWRLIGWGQIRRGTTIDIATSLGAAAGGAAAGGGGGEGSKA